MHGPVNNYILEYYYDARTREQLYTRILLRCTDPWTLNRLISLKLG